MKAEQNWRVVNREVGRVGVRWGCVLVVLSGSCLVTPAGLGATAYTALATVLPLVAAAHAFGAMFRAERLLPPTARIVRRPRR